METLKEREVRAWLSKLEKQAEGKPYPAAYMLGLLLSAVADLSLEDSHVTYKILAVLNAKAKD